MTRAVPATLRASVIAILMWLTPGATSAGLTQHDLADVALTPPPNAVMPLDLTFQDTDGRKRTLRDAIGQRAAIVLFVDYTCRTVCRPAVAIVSGALEQTGLIPNRDFRLLIVGLDPKDTSADAKQLLQQIGDPAVGQATTALMNDGHNVAQLAQSAGYRFAYDAQIDQYAHPAGLLVLNRDGRITRTLSSLAANPQDLKLALVEAGEGRVGGIQDRLTLLCYGFDAVHGIYTPVIRNLLDVGAGLTVLAVAGALLLLWRRERAAGERPS